MPSKFIDFQDVKSKVNIEDAATLLGLSLKPSGAQMRGPCPACKSGGDRALVITPAKQAFYCFGAGQGGDVIALVAHIKSRTMKEAAELLATGSDRPQPDPPGQTRSAGPVRTQGNTVPENKKAGLNPLTYLLPEHPAVQALGISPETCSHFGAGYAPKGIMRGRLAIPIHDPEGELVAYCGRAVKDESPSLIFPNGFRPEAHIFGAHAIQPGPLYLMGDPLAVIRAFDGGIDNAVSFLTEAVSPQQLEMLSSLMDEKKCETVEIN